MNRDRSLLVLFVLTLIFAGNQSQAADVSYHVGGRSLVWRDQARKRLLIGHLWYPTELSQVEQPIPINPMFVPMNFAPGAPLAVRGDKFPVVLLSHGSGGLGAGLFWMGGFLASQGYVVIAVDHPGNKFMDNTGVGLMRVWDRAKDLSFALDQVVKMKEFAPHLETTKVIAMGHSAGGATAFLLAGGRLDPKKFENPLPLCAQSNEAFAKQLCQEIEKIKPGTFTADEIGKDYRDSRVAAAVAFDPGFVRSFRADSLKSVPAKLLVITADHLTDASNEIYAKEFSKLVPTSSFFILPDSVHMTFLQTCLMKSGVEESDIGTICEENSRREQKHEEIRARVSQFLKTQL